MSRTQDILRSVLLLSLGGLAACGEPLEEDGSYCFNIEEGGTCPSLDEVNADYLPEEETCGTIEHVEATDGPEQSDVPISGMMTLENYEGDSCCYTTLFHEVRNEATCVIGRPLLQAGRPQVARTRIAADNPWRGVLSGIRAGQSPAARQAAGRFYLKTALYEHASVASFQKFGLELMRFGAPPELLERAQRAALDEIHHARMGFAIASELLGSQAQPGPLDYTPQLSETLLEFAAATLTEGAIGETLAVLLAAEQRRHASDPGIRAFLDQVITDESRHAELAWDTLRWCIRQDPAVSALLAAAMNLDPVIGLAHYPVQPIPGLGLPGRAVLEQVVKRGFERVILPSLQALQDQALREQAPQDPALQDPAPQAPTRISSKPSPSTSPAPARAPPAALPETSP